MKKLKNLGKALNKAEQKSINGGRFTGCGNLNRCYTPSYYFGLGDGSPCAVHFPTWNITCNNGTLQSGQCCF